MPSPSSPYRRRSVRLQGYDYAQDGAYFVTICTANRACLFGQIVDGELRLDAFGEAVQRLWEDMPAHHRGVELDAFVVMPNHIHGIVVFAYDEGEAGLATTGAQETRRADEAGLATTTTTGAVRARRKRTLGTVVAGFKSAVSREARAGRIPAPVSLWQQGYYEHIIRSEAALDRIREYIANNPAKWAFDHDNPANWSPSDQT
jgi:REP-associated tyrosine transposase